MFLSAINASGQTYTLSVVTEDFNSSVWGLSIVNNSVAWVSGDNGTKGRLLDEDKTGYPYQKRKDFMLRPGQERRIFSWLPGTGELPL